MESFLSPLVGGLLIGASSSLMLWGLGRVTGVSGIYSSVLSFDRENMWKYSFILGLVFGGFLLSQFYANTLFNYQITGSSLRVIIAGLLVGFGTRLGNGCTSGHGVCGIPRLAKRSILATITFILVGMLVVGIEGALK
ncbi:YeeE/YedE family protein [Halobacteriovorax marinus]|uniref:YeeE/YedE family protein n=1 Tax=Halobacteriovorax marinus TaxID=97084 RepID=UPI000BC31E00|nr:YeeE/YedE thiosulfate transporter family protein [Halobacteriovorax marinus]ATH06814.1 YeeE/YedE family protein [Halobacteriovorax marinus]